MYMQVIGIFIISVFAVTKTSGLAWLSGLLEDLP